MSTSRDMSSVTFSAPLVRARAKVLAREDREMKSDLIRLRREQGLTQKDVADLLGVTQQAIYKLERYDSDPKSSTIRRYANAVGALVEHRVAPDLGQSVALAAPPRWDSVSTTSTMVSMVGRKTFSQGRGTWSDSSAVHQPLAG